MKVRRSRTTAWQQPILRRFGVIHVAGAPISGFTRGDLKPTGISGHAPRSYTDLGRPFRERAGERRFGVAPKDRPKPRRFGVIHAGIRRSGVSRRFGVIHQNLRRSGKNPYKISYVDAKNIIDQCLLDPIFTICACASRSLTWCSERLKRF